MYFSLCNSACYYLTFFVLDVTSLLFFPPLASNLTILCSLCTSNVYEDVNALCVIDALPLVLQLGSVFCTWFLTKKYNELNSVIVHGGKTPVRVVRCCDLL